MYATALFILFMSMLVQWINQIGWLILVSVPNYKEIAELAPELVKPAFSAIAIYVPLITFYRFVRWIFFYLNDTKDIKDSITNDSSGLNLTPNKTGTGKYTCEIKICMDSDKGKPVIVPEQVRFESTLIVGGSGTRKNNNSN